MKHIKVKFHLLQAKTTKKGFFFFCINYKPESGLKCGALLEKEHFSYHGWKLHAIIIKCEV